MVGYGPGPQKPAKVAKRLILARLVVAIAIIPQRTQPEPPLVRATQQTDGVGVTVPGITVLVDVKIAKKVTLKGLLRFQLLRVHQGMRGRLVLYFVPEVLGRTVVGHGLPVRPWGAMLVTLKFL